MNKRFATIVSWSIIALFAMTVTVISPLLSEMSKTFSISMAQSGVLFAANSVGFVTFVLLGGILADRFGKRAVLSVSLIGFTVTLFLFPLAPDFYTACAVITLLGGLGGMVESILSALVVELNGDNHAFYLNITHMFFGVGAVVGPVAAGIIVASGADWKVCYYALSAVSLLLTVIFIPIKLPPISSDDKISLSSFKTLVTDKKFVLICLCVMFYTGAEVSGWGWMSTFLKKTLSFSIAKSSIAVGIFWVAMTLGRYICASLTLKFEVKRIVAVLASVSAAATILSGLVSGETAVWLIILVMGLSYSGQWPSIVSYGSMRYKNAPGTVFALLVGSGGLGSMIIPYITGVMGENVGIRAAMISPAVLLIAVALIFMAFGNEDKNKKGIAR